MQSAKNRPPRKKWFYSNQFPPKFYESIIHDQNSGGETQERTGRTRRSIFPVLAIWGKYSETYARDLLVLAFISERTLLVMNPDSDPELRKVEL